MRILEKRRGYFRGTHKGAEIEIERETRPYPDPPRFYIRVTWKDGTMMYDGYAPESVTNTAAAKREAIRGSWLDRA